jgi:hypothetical protein
MIDECKICQANDGRNYDIENRLTHLQLLLNSMNDEGEFTHSAALCLAGALNAGEPVEEPKTNGTRNVENHLSDLDLDLTIGSGCRGHHVSFLVGNKNA